MYTRRSSSTSVRLISGFAIIVMAVISFIVYQELRQPPTSVGPSQTATPLYNFKTALPTAAPTSPPIDYRVISAEANLSAPIIELYYATDSDNWDLSHLADSAGHLEGTADMGKGGNFVLAGHVELKDGSQGPFAYLKSLKAGNRITIIGDTQPQPSVVLYVVTGVEKVAPSDFNAIRNHGYEELTLITCDDWDAQTQIYNSRIIVHARPANSLLTATPSPTAVLRRTATAKKK